MDWLSVLVLVFIGGAGAYFAGRALERLWISLTPRVWHATTIPDPVPVTNWHYGLVASVLTLAFAVLVERFLSRGAVPTVFVLGWSGALAAGVVAFFLGRRTAWLLPPEHPFRAGLSGTVWLRPGNRLTPKISLNGTITLETALLRLLSPAEQRAVLILTRHRHRTRQPLKNLALWSALVVGFFGASIGVVELTRWVFEKAQFTPLAVVPLVFIGQNLWLRPRFSQSALERTLEEIGDLAAIESVVRQVDPGAADARLAALSAWWDARRPPATAAPAAPSVQTLGRRP